MGLPWLAFLLANKASMITKSKELEYDGNGMNGVIDFDWVIIYLWHPAEKEVATNSAFASWADKSAA